MQDLISNALNCMMNSKKAGKKICIVPSSNFLIRLLEILKKEGHVSNYEEDHGENVRNVRIELGKINECKAIKPRYYVSKEKFDKYVKRFLPARDFGILIVSTSQGLMGHREALEKGIGGSLIAYCF